eukprot:TRINITY_DN800_c0_g4_i3.p1 TRINITY_DN800_c0_g4~~TRINITY_DN800_c0_g4_i3.p1  ORF type:complete len:128 (+),score=15.71 TRINITY_DN800_c0_g4_i3:1414-1797(+)
MEYEPKMWVAVALITLITIQVIILALQKIKGPQFFLPEKWRTSCYNYHRKIIISGAKLASSYDDCSICLENVSVYPGGEGKKKKLRKKYYNTPCSHSFHTECLTKWMLNKTSCPVCRNYLPPLNDAE